MSDLPLVAIIIKTLLREHEFKNLILSIKKYCDVPYRLYVADEGSVDKAKQLVLTDLGEGGHFVTVYGEPTGQGVGWYRNRLFEATTVEPYVLRLDDDFVFTESTSIKKMIQVLETSSRVGIVSCAEIQGEHGKQSRANNGQPVLDAGMMFMEGTQLRIGLLPDNGWIYSQVNGVRYAFADYTRNFLLIKRKLLEESPWCEKLVINGEHLDFFLSAKLKGWQIAFTPDVSYIHAGSPENLNVGSSYYSKRNTTRAEQVKAEVFKSKYGIDQISKFKINDKTRKSASLIAKIKKAIQL